MLLAADQPQPSNLSYKGNSMAYETTNAAGVGTATDLVVALFNQASNAHQAIAALRANGFISSQIGAAFRNQASTGVAGHDKENWWEKVKDAFRPEEDKVEKRREAAADPTVNPDPYARGEYEYDLAGHDFENSLTATGIAPDRAAYLSRNLRSGGAIVTVRDTDRAAEAEQILSANGGKIRSEGTTEIDAADSTGRGVTDTGYTDRRPVEGSTPGLDRVQLFGEVLRVHKDRINRGEARIHKDVVTENQTIEVPVTREELVLERVPVSGNTPVPASSIGSSQEIRVPLSEETVRLEKQAVVREEIMVGKREVEKVTTVGDAVRHEELRVDSDVDSDVEAPKRTVAGEELGDLRRHG
jgi:uncharacterized protein (TIGR02271 family)